MKKILIFSFIIIYSFHAISYATDEITTDSMSKEAKQVESGNANIAGYDSENDEKYSGDNSGENKHDELKNQDSEGTSSGEAGKLSEEGASVDTSMTQANYNVEAPTIVLLSLFGILTVISLILFVMKI